MNGVNMQKLAAEEALLLKKRIATINRAMEQMAREKRLAEARLRGLETYLSATDRTREPEIPEFVTDAKMFRVMAR